MEMLYLNQLKNYNEAGSMQKQNRALSARFNEKASSGSVEHEERLKDIKDKAEKARSKRLIVFDLDGTLAESKATIDTQMSGLLNDLLKQKMVAVIGGGAYSQFEKQFLANLHIDKDCLKNLFLFPTSGASFYRCQDGTWIKKYEHKLTSEQQKEIIAALDQACENIDYKQPEKIWGDVIENRGTQITFSALGQDAPVAEKKEWNKKNDNRRKDLIAQLKKIIPEFEIRSGGLTSIDITKKGIDKAFGIDQIVKTLHVSKDEMIFIGDALYEGGNDYPVKTTGVQTVKVSGPEDTKLFIKTLLNKA